MRYDVTFKLGDYIGPLDYSFTGDDDLWVILDGNKVVIDLGGIHNTAEGKTNLWNDLGLTPGKLTDDQKNQTHTLTILYMERGATASNCTMNFTLPSARISEVTNVPMADLTFNKINSKNEGISGAAFKLVNDADPSEVYTASSYGNEGTVKFDCQSGYSRGVIIAKQLDMRSWGNADFSFMEKSSVMDLVNTLKAN